MFGRYLALKGLAKQFAHAAETSVNVNYMSHLSKYGSKEN